MAKILIFDPGGKNIPELTPYFPGFGNETVFCAATAELERAAVPALDRYDVVILVLSGDTRFDLRVLEFIRSRSFMRPKILCVALSYRGPQVQLDMERRGARFVYAI